MKRRLYIIVTAPLEVIGCALWGAARGLRDGVLNVRDAWRETIQS
jgi:hypothetical protein